MECTLFSINSVVNLTLIHSDPISKIILFYFSGKDDECSVSHGFSHGISDSKALAYFFIIEIKIEIKVSGRFIIQQSDIVLKIKVIEVSIASQKMA